MSSGGGSVAAVHGYDVEQAICKVTFEVAVTAENVEFARDAAARRKTGLTSTVRLVEDTSQMIYVEAMLTNKPELEFAAEGNLTLEYHGLLAGS